MAPPTEATATARATTATTGPYGYRSATAMFPYAPSGGYGYRYGTVYDYDGVREAYRSVYNPNFTGYYNPYRPYGNWQY